MFKGITLILLCLVSSQSLAGKSVSSDLIDMDWASVQASINKERAKSCSGLNNLFKKMDCFSRVKESYRAKGDVRGTSEYINKRFANLDKAGLRELVKQYNAKIKLARTQLDLPHQLSQFESGELDKTMLKIELSEIKELLASKTPKGCTITMTQYLKSLKDPSILNCGDKK